MTLPQPLASDRLQTILRHAHLNRRQTIVSATQNDTALWKRWIGLPEEIENLHRLQQNLMVKTRKQRRNLHRMKRLMLQRKELLRLQRGACAVLAPLMRQQ